jgi:four helix bundle protein
MMNQNARPAGRTNRALSTAGLDGFDCYRLALAFATTAPGLVPREHTALRDQLERASTSVVLNIGEGWGHWERRQKVQCYAIARGSLLESGAAIDLLRARGLADASDCEQARALCTRITQMLNGLIRAVEQRSGDGRATARGRALRTASEPPATAGSGAPGRSGCGG